jgi:hypothetical protein
VAGTSETAGKFLQGCPGPSFDLVLKVDGIVGKGEPSVFRVGLPRADCESVSGAVERGSKVGDGIMSAICEGIHGNRISDSDFQNLMIRSLRIRLEKRSLLVSAPGLAEFPFKVSAVFLCARDLSA